MNNNQPDSSVPNERIFSALGCIGLLFLVPMIVGKGSELCKFYANYGLNLTLLGIAGGLIAMIAFFIVPTFGLIFYGVLCFCLFVAAVVGFIFALQGKQLKLPLLSTIKLIK